MTDGSISQPNILVSEAQRPITEISTDHAMSTDGGSSLSVTEQYPSDQRDSGLPHSAGLVRRLQGRPTEDDIVEALREGLDKCLDVFFGTHDRAGKDDMVQPQAGKCPLVSPLSVLDNGMEQVIGRNAVSASFATA